MAHFERNWLHDVSVIPIIPNKAIYAAGCARMRDVYNAARLSGHPDPRVNLGGLAAHHARIGVNAHGAYPSFSVPARAHTSPSCACKGRRSERHLDPTALLTWRPTAQPRWQSGSSSRPAAAAAAAAVAGAAGDDDLVAAAAAAGLAAAHGGDVALRGPSQRLCAPHAWAAG
eukprot:12373-Chlamydomonas_euryale.AAC.3